MPTCSDIEFKGLINNLEIGIFRQTPQDQFLFVNQELSKMLGFSQKDLVKKKIQSIFKVPKQYQSIKQKMRTQGYVRGEEIRLKRKDKSILWCHVTARAVKDKKGKTQWIDGIVEDISVRKRIERELLESKKLFRAVFDNSAIGITITDKDEKIVAWNPFAEKILCMKGEDLFNKPVKDLYPQKEWRRIRVRHIRQRGVFSNMETQVIRTDGKLIDIYLSISLLKDFDGNVTGAIGIMRDITERITAERKLRDSEQKIRVILDNSAAAITLLDKNERIISWNKFTEELLGMKKKDLYMKPVSILYPKEEWKKIRAANIRKLGSKEHLETRVIKKDKSILDVDLSVNVLKDSKNNIISSVGIMQDITERKRTRDELIQAKIEAEEASNSKTLFLANVSHEVRTPMNAILGMVDMTLDTELTDEQRENLKTVQDAANNLLSLLNDILDLSRIEASKINLEVIEFNIRDVIQNVCRGLHVLARNKNLELLWSVDHNVPKLLKGDPVRLRQVIINFVNNAIKFTAKGKIEIGTKIDEISDKSCQLEFVVTDTGIGIPKDKQKIIFDAFAQADDSITRRYGGTGLGLAISTRLVDMMGGRIWLESEQGKGSKFYFTSNFALVEKKMHTSEESKIEKKELPRSLLDEKLPSLRVLLAEDNPVSQKIMTRLLTKKGWKVCTVRNGQEVLGFIAKDSFDIILMDVQMPIMDGLEATKVIREGEKQTGKHVLIVAMTARAMEEDKRRCLAAGMDGYVSKPIDRVRLFEVIGSLIKKGKNNG